MECYEGATMIKTFRGRMVDDTQDAISLHTNDGSMGYRILKMQMLPTHASKDIEGVIKIYSTRNANVTTPTTDIDFSDNELVAAAIVTGAHSHEIPWDSTVVFDHIVFNQDIYVTWKCNDKIEDINYYLELEQVKLDINSNTVATLKDMRNTATPLP